MVTVQNFSTSSLLNIEKFVGDNYSTWSESVELVLMQQGVDHCLTEVPLTEEQKKKPEVVSKREADDRKAYSLIGLSIDAKIRSGLGVTSKSPKELWEKVRDIYRPTTGFAVMRLCRDLFRLDKREDESMQSFISNFEQIHSKLVAHGRTFDDELLAWSLLWGLPPSKDTFVMAYTSSLGKEKPTKTAVIQALLLEESRTKKAHASLTDPYALVAVKSWNKVCHRCGGRGHFVSSCPSVPEGSTNQGSIPPTSTAGSSQRGRSSGRKFRHGRGKSQASQFAAVQSDDEENIALFLTPLPKDVRLRDVWTLDTGCTRHMASNKDWFISLRAIEEEKITTANAQASLSAKWSGTVVVQSINPKCTLTLTDVLYVPNLSANLLSASSIVKKDCGISIDKFGCSIYLKEKLLVKGVLKRNLFLLELQVIPIEIARARLADNECVTLNAYCLTAKQKLDNFKHTSQKAHTVKQLESSFSCSSSESMDKGTKLIEVTKRTDKKPKRNNAVKNEKVFRVGNSRENSKKVKNECVNLNTDSSVLLDSPTVKNIISDCEVKDPFAEKKNDYANTKVNLWHRRYLHISIPTLVKLKKANAVNNFDFPLRKLQSKFACWSCNEANSPTKPFPKKALKRATCPNALWHSDLAGPFEARSLNGSRYWLTVLDDYSRYITLFFLKSKDEAKERLKDFIVQSEKQTGFPVKSIRTDRGLEFCNEELDSFLTKLGIVHQTTVKYSPSQNGAAERLNRTILELVRPSLAEAKLPPSFWAEAANTAAFMKKNLCVSSVVNETTPYELWFGKKPDVKPLRAFGCLCFVQIPKINRSKMQP